MTRRWRMNSDLVASAETLIDRILRARGLDDPDAIRRFCNPKLTDLEAPANLPNVNAAADRLVDAVRAGRHIAIYGDYDVDGMTATAILFHILRAVDPAVRITTYVPHRLDEGYGLNVDAMRKLHADGAELMITVDCGVTAIEPARVAKEIGLELIITDHHLPEDGGELPDALLVHPGLPGSTYPFVDLCGAGVAFKLAWRFANRWCNSERVSESLQRTLLDLLPLAALGTIADVVPLVGENRILTLYGLNLIKKTPLVGLRALLEASNLTGEAVDAEKVGFVLAPRLNACGRMGHAADAVRLLTEANVEEAREIAERLTTMNDQRKKTERHIAEEAAQMAIDAGLTDDDCRIIVLAHPEWHPGVIGIVCSRLVDRFGRPTILMQDNDGVCRGSARSIDGFSIHDALVEASEHLESYGGHAMAAGVRLASDNLPAFRAALQDIARRDIALDELTPAITIDCDARMSELDQTMVGRIRTLSPFGRANRRPTVRVCRVTIAEPPRVMGANGRHLSLRVRDEITRREMRGVWWGSGDLASRFAKGMTVDIAIEPKLNDWRGKISVEGEIRDVRICE